MTRRGRPLLRLTVVFALLSGLAWTARYLLGNGRLPARAPLPAFSQLSEAFTAATVVTLVIWGVFRGIARGLERSERTTALRPLNRLESAVSVAIIAVFAVVVFLGTSNTLISLGLVGFGLTLALQRPLLALAGWVYLVLDRPFTEGDRIEVAGIVGDVLEIGFMNTHLWELGSDASPLGGWSPTVENRPTGRTLTLSNAMFLEEPTANATTDIDYIFDEFVVAVAYEADRALAHDLLEEIASEVIDLGVHERAARAYERLTRGMTMERSFPREPVILQSLEADWIELRLRYLVDVRSLSKTRKALSKAWLAHVDEHPDELPNVYPRTQMMHIGRGGRGLDP